jgi:hypothetical protein
MRLLRIDVYAEADAGVSASSRDTLYRYTNLVDYRRAALRGCLYDEHLTLAAA